MILAVVLAGLFVVLLWSVRGAGPVVVLDGVVQAGLAGVRSRWVIAAFDWLTQIGTGAAGAAVLVAASGLLAGTGRAGAIGPMWLAFVGAEATSWSVKFITGRARPPFIEGLTAASPSFPSAHATVSVAAYGFLTLLIAQGIPDRRSEVLVAGAALVLLVMVSRMVLSLHYLSDVIGGALVGGAWVALAWRLLAEE